MVYYSILVHLMHLNSTTTTEKGVVHLKDSQGSAAELQAETEAIESAGTAKAEARQLLMLDPRNDTV